MIITLTDVPASPGLDLCLHSGYQQGQITILKKGSSRGPKSPGTTLLLTYGDGVSDERAFSMSQRRGRCLLTPPQTWNNYPGPGSTS